MTDDKNHVAAVKDARGYQVTYAWDTKKDLLNSVKDARNSTTFYTYDAKTERLASVSKTVKAKGQDQEVKVEYGYSNDRLTRITHNGFNYGFGYDEFGKTRLVAIAGSSVVSYEYEEKNGKLLKTKYANGDSLRYEYDTQGRLVRSTITVQPHRKSRRCAATAMTVRGTCTVRRILPLVRRIRCRMIFWTA